MKPLPAAPLTYDDMMIWRRVCGLAGYHAYFRLGCLEMKGQRADRRDAEQMFERMKWQVEGLEQGYDWRTERRGWFPSDWGRASDEYLNPL
jgi:hypothetical protein